MLVPKRSVKSLNCCIVCCSKLDVVYGKIESDWILCDDVAGSIASEVGGMAKATGCFFCLVVTGDGVSSLILLRGRLRFSAKKMFS